MAEAKKKSTKKELKEAELVVEAASAIELEEKEEKVTAKAGKRSPKATREAEAEKVKEERKTSTEASKPKVQAKPPRSRAERAGKKYREAAKQIDKAKLYSLAQALELATKTSPVKFDASVELHVNLGVDPKQADQNVRGTVVMPAGTGKNIKVAVLDEASAEALFAELDKEQVDFDILIATPEMMPRLGKYARLLGPRGLMPNPKSGTVTADTKKAAEEAKAGKVEYRVDQAGIVHLAIGKVSFGADKLVQNAEAVLSSIRAAKPASLKGIYIKSVYVSSTMGPSIKLDLNA